MEYKTCLTFMFILSAVYCEKCVGKDGDSLLISHFGMCQEHQWNFNQDGVRIDNPNNISNISTPSAQTTCIASNTLSFVSGGVLEAEVFTQSIITKEEYLTILAFGEDNNVVGHATLHGEENELNDGWHVLKETLGGVGHYDGFIMIISKTSLNSDIMVGSMCYSPAQQQEILSEYTSEPSNYVAPDIYNLQTGSVLKYPVYTNEDIETPVVVSERFFWIFDREDFWTPLTISLAVIIPVIFLALLCWACYALGKCRGAKQDPQIMYEDVDNLPKPYLVPRVKSVYSESVADSSYGARNNNIYSV